MSHRQWFYLTRVDHDGDERDLTVRANVTIDGALIVNGSTVGSTGSVRSISGGGSAETDDDIVLVDISGGSDSFSLMPASSRDRPLVVKVRRNAGVNVLTLEPDGEDTIDGQPTLQLAAGDSATLIKDPESPNAWESI